MFDDRFRLKPAFLHNERALRKRFRCDGMCVFMCLLCVGSAVSLQ